ncbi:putative bifunctional diguanylate cyclase/phosphodiesterase [Aquabacter cavernae]|uniref:putative bifunctional diguanylate cyclase/phosphodiesterase n=1 Tax=Aquabacter cavernae TaxID=2496029 RepID=UPI000F8E1CBD|nr:EAL domain-containing protein [Aquabacter cavernae]
MEQARLNAWTGEFVSRDQERAYRVHRTAETLRHARILGVVSLALNLLFMLSDMRLMGTPHYTVALWSRVGIILVALACLFVLRRTQAYERIEAVLLTGVCLTGVGVAFLVSIRSDVALLGMVLYPVIAYLAVPLRFRWRVATGMASSVALLLSYVGIPPQGDTAVGLTLAMLMLNLVMILVAVQSNREGRMEWAASQAERIARKTLLQSQHLLEHTFTAVPIPLIITEVEDGRIVRFNEAGVRYFGGPPQAFGVESVGPLYENPNARADFLDRLAREGRVTNFETRIRLGHGELRSVLLAGAFTEVDGRPCVVTGVVDITDRLAAEQKVHHAATHDALTGLINRAAFQTKLDEVIRAARPEDGLLVLLLVDLDGLKDVNDTLGHDAGDVLLMETARRLEHLAGDLGAVARLGGDEFVILLPRQPSVQAALDLADAILRDFRHPLAYGDRTLSCRASIGIAVCPSADYAPGELMKDADLALYTAKKQGRNRAVLYAPAMRRAMTERVRINRELGSALQKRTIIPYYQPKISLVTGRVVGLEALMRWQQGNGVVAPPDKFISAFEDPELAVQMGETILRQIANDARSWLNEGCGFGRIAFNLASAQFTQPRLASQLLGVVWDAEVEPRHFDVEVTETVFLGRDSEYVAPILDELYAAGMRIALDDFGTGYAALTHLKQLPIDAVKIDRSFVAHLDSDPFDSAIVCAVIELGKNLGLRVIAEGVETPSQARFLRERGCEYAQGYLYGHPMPAAAMTAFLQRETSELAAARVAQLWT